MKPMELAKKDENQTILGLKQCKRNYQKCNFVLCIENGDCEDLEKRKFYQILPDEKAAQEGYLRIVDESQEDYLYPEFLFHQYQNRNFQCQSS